MHRTTNALIDDFSPAEVGAAVWAVRIHGADLPGGTSINDQLSTEKLDGLYRLWLELCGVEYPVPALNMPIPAIENVR